MGAATQLKNLYQQVVGGVAPSGTASASGDISQMVKYIAAGSSTVSWTPLLGFSPPYVAGESDATISGNTTITGSVGGVKRYRDLTINSNIVLTCEQTPQIIICRNLAFGNTSSEIRAAYNTAQDTAAGIGGYGGSWYGTDSATGALNTGSAMMAHFSAGGAGANGAATPVAASNGSAYTGNASMLLMTILSGTQVNGGGNGGNSAITTQTNGVAGGVYGSKSANTGSSGNGGGAGGGSGIGGGGGAGGLDTDQAGSPLPKAGGRGGGVVIVIVTGDVTTAAGLITANGENGLAAASSTSKGAGSGAGGGGFVALLAKASTVTPTLQANGGTGGTAGNGGSAGGNGGAGATFRVVG